MKKMTIVKGVATGAMVGAAVGMIGAQIVSSSRNGGGLKKSAAKALRTVGNVIDSIEYFIK